jgi:hypothetical protein
MGFSDDPTGDLAGGWRRFYNPTLYYIFIDWFIETYGEEWWWAHTDWSMNYALIGRPQRKLLISFDNKQSYSTMTPAFGVFDLNAPSPILLMPLNIADPSFFSRLKVLVDKTISTTEKP